MRSANESFPYGSSAVAERGGGVTRRPIFRNEFGFVDSARWWINVIRVMDEFPGSLAPARGHQAPARVDTSQAGNQAPARVDTYLPARP